ncbi:hydrogenase expression/formation protein HypE [Photobacterium lipolyticum]|uniref:Hydrogenase expression/formation protein HypE n=1 Tax=Photobacterium lipolyticum TaxID=266810 RepID=A0A2T3MWJ5_9GAMM|nr:hydrogenase expression/formation protein HypE [Photobacterium lipolyticum]PSW04205.1 hydrogenase expression/formation protein HypE [Photobacterium lipolyticum]
MNELITLAHGSGGGAMQQLIQDVFIQSFSNTELDKLEDQARISLPALQLAGNRLAFSTDSYVIDPIFFPGGDIGKIAVCGTANDVAMSGARPEYLSCGFILEEGLPIAVLKQVVQSMADTAAQIGIKIVTGDTKVVPKGAVDKLFINTSGLGVIPQGIDYGADKIQPGDQVIVSGTIGDHGATILNLREKLGIEGNLSSDCQHLYPVVAALKNIQGVRALRDATRGGVNAVLHEFCSSSGCGITVSESQLPISSQVRGICELLGLDPINFANEGKLIAVVTKEDAEDALAAMRITAEGENAAIIGEVNDQRRVTLSGLFGGTRRLDLPSFEPLPRIC